MKFKIDLAVKKVEGTMFYIWGEHSFYFAPYQSVDLTFVFDYLLLGVNSESMLACKINGFNPYEGWIKKSLKVPFAVEGGLSLEGVEEYERDPWLSIEIVPHDIWQTYYDKESSLVCFGDYETRAGDQAVEFLNGVIAVLDNDSIKAFWFKPVFVQELPSDIKKDLDEQLKGLW